MKTSDVPNSDSELFGLYSDSDSDSGLESGFESGFGFKKKSDGFGFDLIQGFKCVPG